MRVEIRSRPGNIVVGVLGVVYSAAAIVLFVIHLLQTWGAASLIDRAIQVMLVGVCFVSIWFLLIALRGLGVRWKPPLRRQRTAPA